MAIISATAALCQQAQIAGLIRDPSGLNVAGAEISVRNEQSGARRETKSNGSGFYSVASLNPGTYRLLIRCAGFETIVQEGVKLEVGDHARLDFTPRIGDAASVVTVEGGRPLMNTEDASIGTVIGREIIDEMPLNGRGIQSLIELTPGVEAVPVIAGNAGQFSVNGQRSVSNYFTVDGVSANFGAGALTTLEGGGLNITQAGGARLPANNLLGTFSNLVSPDALQEFRIQTSTFAPEYGRAPGAQVGFITRSGTSHYSGSLFEYFRNDVFDANDWFADQGGQPKAALRFNNFGGTFGGPLRIPHLVRGDGRTFFFFSFEELVMRQPQPPIWFAVPTAQTRLSFSPLSSPLYNALPLPNAPDLYFTPPGWGGFIENFSLPTHQQTWGLRFDRYFSDKLIGFLRFNQSPSRQTQDNAAAPLTPFHYSAGSGMLTAGMTEAVSPALVNELRANFSWQNLSVNSHFVSLNGAAPFPAGLLFPPGYSAQNSEIAILDVLASDGYNPGIPGVQVGFDGASHSRQIQIVDQLSYARGTHQFKFGADYRMFTLAAELPKTSTSYIFNDLADGIVSNLDEAVVPAGVAYRAPAFSLYAQDTWHPLRRLSITYGVRWELEPAPRSTNGNAAVYNPLPGLDSLADITTAPPGAPFYHTHYTNFAPRAGIAWQVLDSGEKKTVLRAGVGLFFDSAQGGFQSLSAAKSDLYLYPNASLGTFPSGGNPSYGSGSSEFAPVVLSGYTLPRTYEWNATLEQSFGQQTFSAGYVGAIGRRLLGSIPGPTYVLPSTILPAGLEIIGNAFSSSYNALQLQFNRRLGKGFQAMLSYTWSHAIDNLSDELGENLFPLNLTMFTDPNQNRGDSDFDVRQSFHGALFFAFPSPSNGLGRTLLHDWTASTIFFARTALPENLITFTSTYAEMRPDVVPGQPLYLYSSGYPGGRSFNPAAFTSPPDDAVQGNLGRNVLRGLGAWQADVALHRSFRLSEHTNLQFRTEAFNVFNHPNFANPSLGSPQETLALGPHPGVPFASLASGLSPFGALGQLDQLFQIGGPRTLQLALRFTF